MTLSELWDFDTFLQALTLPKTGPSRPRSRKKRHQNAPIKRKK